MSHSHVQRTGSTVIGAMAGCIDATMPMLQLAAQALRQGDDLPCFEEDSALQLAEDERGIMPAESEGVG